MKYFLNDQDLQTMSENLRKTGKKIEKWYCEICTLKCYFVYSTLSTLSAYLRVGIYPELILAGQFPL